MAMINLKINGEFYRLEIDPEKEEHYRKAGKLLNDTIASYNLKFNEISYYKLLTMVALDMAVNLVKTEADLDDANHIISELERIS